MLHRLPAAVHGASHGPRTGGGGAVASRRIRAAGAPYRSRVSTADVSEPTRAGRRRASRRGWSTRRKLAVSAIVLVAAAAVATRGSTATFTASASRSHQITTGNPALLLGTAGTAANRLGIDVTALVPGASAYRAFDITNTGTQAFTAYSLTTVAASHSALDTDTTNGLQIKLDSCPTAWAETGTAGSYAYTCSVTPTPVLASRPIIQSAVPLVGMQSAAPDGVDHLRLTETLPSTADSTFQNITSSITYTFNGS